MLAFWQYGHIQSRIESWAAAAIPNRLEYSYPLLDKRIIEFALGIPAEYCVSNKIGRFLFRSAANGLLPEKILWADTKVERNRVERLASLVHSGCKLMIANRRIRDEQSDYIDNGKLVSTLQKMELTSMDQGKFSQVWEIKTSMSVTLSQPMSKE
jgi:asparagine synthase (glutamine-hydrolysing)